MHVAVYLPLIVPLLAALAAGPLAERLPPAAASWLLAGAAIALALASSAVLGMLALTALLRVPFVDSLGSLSRTVISRNDPASLPVAVVAGAFLAAAVTAAARLLTRRVAAVAAAHRQARSLPGRAQVVVTDDEAADAYTLPGWPCRIVITSGMLRALSGEERQVLLHHERAHAAGFHFLFVTAARLAAAANPLLRPVASAVGYTVERWADERAAAATGDRRMAAQAVARAALAAKAAPAARDVTGWGPAGLALGAIGGPAAGMDAAGRPRGPVGGAVRGRGDVGQPLGPVGGGVGGAVGGAAVGGAMAGGALGRNAPRGCRSWLRRPGPVPRRVAALLRPAPQPRVLLLCTVVLVVGFAGGATLEAAKDLHGLLEYARAAALAR